MCWRHCGVVLVRGLEGNDVEIQVLQKLHTRDHKGRKRMPTTVLYSIY